MREDRFLLGPLIARALQQYWRLTRGVYLTAEACVIDEAGRTLMVRDASDSWSLPATATQKGESLEMALRRVLRDIAGIEVNSKPELRGFYAESRDRQTGLYVVRNWHELAPPNALEMRFFALGALPAGVQTMTAERIRRSHEGRTISQL